MIPTRVTLMDLVPMPDSTCEFIVDQQQTDDIIFCVYDSVRNSEGYVYSGNVSTGWVKGQQKGYTREYAPLFLRGNTTPTDRVVDGKKVVKVDLDGICHDIWDFMQYEWPYDVDAAETKEKQTGRTVNRIIYDLNPEYFDCKHYSIFAFATLRALGIPCILRLTSYDFLDPSASHVYVVAGKGKFDPDTKTFEEEFVIDGTMPEYNQETKKGVSLKYNVKITE